MVVPQAALDRAREMLESTVRPLFLHDDDCDGTTSYVICSQYSGKHKGEGKSIPVKRSPSVTTDFLRYIDENGADLVVILDKPKVDVAFLQDCKVPVLWIDHHEPQRDTVKGLSSVFYLNPRLWDDADNRPTSYWSYQITKTNLWLATIGSIGDWFVPDYLDEFKALYPDLVPEHCSRDSKVEELYLDTAIGTLIRVIQFNLKGITSESKKSVATLTRIESPYEILKQTSSRGKFLWKKYEKLAGPYLAMLARAQEAAKEQPGKIFLFLYHDDSMTFTSELSNELLIRYPDKIIFVGRKHEGFVKSSVRSKALELPPIITECVKGLDGYGGGHAHACGVTVAEKDWDTFLARLTAIVEKQ